MKHPKYLLLSVSVLLFLIPMTVSGQDGGTSDGSPTEETEPFDFAQWIDRTGAHRIAGYATLGVATTTMILGLSGVDVHPYFGGATAGLAITTATLGTIAYHDRLSVVWPHALLNGIAATGFLLNAFVFEGGSPAHITSGIVSVASLYGAYAAIMIITR